MRARRAEGASADTSRSGGERTTTSEVATDDTFATRLAERAVRFDSEEGAGTDQPDDRRQQPTEDRLDQKSRVARVADFARWAETVTATADDTESQTKRARKRAGRAERRVAAAAVSDITTAEGGRRDGRRRNRALQGGEPGGPSSVPGRYSLGEVGGRLRAGSTPVLGRPTGETVGNQKQEERFGTEDVDRETGGGRCGSAETQRGPASCHDVTPYPGDESLRRSYPGDEVVGILK